MRTWVRLSVVFLVVVMVAGVGQGAAPQGKIHLNIPALTLRYLENDQVVKEYPVAVGKAPSPTPTGQYRVISKVVDPTWYPPGGGQPVPPGPKNPLGGRWLGFAPGYGIHGTNAPKSVGTLASLGCVRMHNRDVEELFRTVSLGTPVEVTYDTVEARWFPKEQTMGVVIYPDVYNWGTNSLSAVTERLRVLALAGAWPAADLAQQLAQGVTNPVELLPTAVNSSLQVTINGQSLANQLYWEPNGYLFPLRVAAEAVGLPIQWNADLGLAMVNGKPVEQGVVREGRTYLTIADLVTMLGLREYWAAESDLYLYRVAITRDAQPLTTDILWDGEGYFLAATGLLEMGVPFAWDPFTQQANFGAGEEVPGFVQDGGLYFSLTDLTEPLGRALGGELHWDPAVYQFKLES